MIGINIEGYVFWFDFPHTLESQDMLLARLEREALERDCEEAQSARARKQMRAIMRMRDHPQGEFGKVRKAFEKFGKAVAEAVFLPKYMNRPVGRAIEDSEFDGENHRVRALLK